MLPKPYYQDQAVTIYHGDCAEILPELGMFDLLLTDPPYGTEGLGGGYGRRQLHSPNGRDGRKIHGDKDLSMAALALGLARAQMGTGYVLAFCAARKMPEMFALVPDAEYIGELIWDKGTPGLGYTVRYTHESALLWKINDAAKPEKALLSMVRDQVNHFNTGARHPHEKPIDFWINAMNLPGKLIVDPFAGTCAVGRAAKDLGRQAVLIEREERYCEIGARRMQQEVLSFEPAPVASTAVQRELAM